MYFNLCVSHLLNHFLRFVPLFIIYTCEWMSIEVKILLGVVLLIIVSLIAYFIYRANKHDYTCIICNRCGSNNLRQEAPVKSDSGETVVPVRCEECGFVNHEAVKRD